MRTEPIDDLRRGERRLRAPAVRRYLTVLFSDLSASTSISGCLHHEYYSELMDEVGRLYERITDSHGGIVAQISGDGLLALFGYPEVREGDARRAVAAALDLHRKVEELERSQQWAGIRLRLHSGIHSGLVLLHKGDAVRGRFEVRGRATNVARHLCNLAQSGEVVVSAATLGPERRFFDTRDCGQLCVDRDQATIAALAVLAPAAGGPVSFAPRGYEATRFVGRAAECGILRRLVEGARSGSAACVLIEGPPGIGKTRLADEAVRAAEDRGCDVHRAACEAAAEPLQPFLQILRSLLALHRAGRGSDGAPSIQQALALDPSLAAHEQTVSRLLSPGPQVPGPQAAPALAALLLAAAARRPQIFFVDDWHLADGASREVLGHLRRIGGAGILGILTARPRPAGEQAIGDLDVIPLGPLTEGEVGEAAAGLLGFCDPFTVAGLCASSGGNPLFLEELCHSIAGGDRAEHLNGGSPWLDLLIAARVARLPPAEAELVKVAAVIGNVFPMWLLEEVSGYGADDAAVTDLAAQDLLFRIERGRALRFKHGVVREAIYNAVGLYERRALHLRIAQALKEHALAAGEEEPFEALAYHYGAAEDAPATAHYAELAGDKAMAASALDRAQAHYRDALSALDRMTPCDEISYRWGRIAQRFGRAGVFDPARDQLPLFERAMELAVGRGDAAALAWAQYWRGYINYALGEPAAAIASWERAGEAAASVRDDRLVVQIRGALGQARAAACQYDQALPLLDEAIEVKKHHSEPGRPPIGVAYSLSCKAFVLGDMGRFSEARACFEEALAAIGGAGHQVEVSVLNQYSAVCLWERRFDAALGLAQAGARVAERVHSHYSHAMSRALGAFARWSMERDPAALETMVEATSWLEARGRGQFTSLNYGWLAEAMVAEGRIAEGRRFAAGALARARKGDRLGEAMASRAMARAAAAAKWRRGPDHYLQRASAAAELRRSAHERAATERCRRELSAELVSSPPAAPRALSRPRRGVEALMQLQGDAGDRRSSP
jgi:tetratricopeptide (TPR) repeat protein